MGRRFLTGVAARWESLPCPAVFPSSLRRLQPELTRLASSLVTQAPEPPSPSNVRRLGRSRKREAGSAPCLQFARTGHERERSRVHVVARGSIDEIGIVDENKQKAAMTMDETPGRGTRSKEKRGGGGRRR